MTEPLDVPDDTDVLMLLASGATATEKGTLDVENLGWWVTAPTDHAHTLLLWLTAPGHRAGSTMAFSARLVDGDGNPVEDDTPRGVEALRVWGAVTVPDPEGLPAGHPIPCPPMFFRVTVSRRLRPGVHEWRAEVEGQMRTEWRRSFVVRGPRS